MHPTLALIVPCYNEEEMLPISSKVLIQLLQGMIDQGSVSPDSFLCFVNDGSKDKTWDIITNLNKRSPSLCHGLNLSRNFGQQGAILAGLFSEQADCYITIDSDLQEDEATVPQMVESFKQGYDIVYGVRNNRSSDTLAKRLPALLFYKIMHWLGTRSVYNSGRTKEVRRMQCLPPRARHRIGISCRLCLLRSQNAGIRRNEVFLFQVGQHRLDSSDVIL
jgi:glycosyltransferase involved in cell wall biosynthesis